MSRDRFDELCEMSDEYWETNAPIEIEAMYAKLLRREHAATVRAVKRLPWYRSELCDGLLSDPQGEWVCFDDVLALLAMRKGRKR